MSFSDGEDMELSMSVGTPAHKFAPPEAARDDASAAFSDSSETSAKPAALAADASPPVVASSVNSAAVALGASADSAAVASGSNSDSSDSANRPSHFLRVGMSESKEQVTSDQSAPPNAPSDTDGQPLDRSPVSNPPIVNRPLPGSAHPNASSGDAASGSLSPMVIGLIGGGLVVILGFAGLVIHRLRTRPVSNSHPYNTDGGDEHWDKDSIHSSRASIVPSILLRHPFPLHFDDEEKGSMYNNRSSDSTVGGSLSFADTSSTGLPYPAFPPPSLHSQFSRSADLHHDSMLLDLQSMRSFPTFIPRTPNISLHSPSSLSSPEPPRTLSRNSTDSYSASSVASSVESLSRYL